MTSLKTEKPKSPLKNSSIEGKQSVVGQGWDFEYDTTRDEFKFMRLEENGLMFLDRLPTSEEMQTIYPSNYYAFSDDKNQPWIIKKVRDFLENRKVDAYKKLMADRKNIHVLDIGAGDGRLLSIIKNHTDENWAFAGIEIGEKGVREGQAKGFEIVLGDVEFSDPQGWDGRFDLILMHQLIEHTRHPAIMLQKCAKWLKPGGIVSIETPESEGWDFHLFNKRYWGGYHFPRHFFIFTRKILAQMGEENGLRLKNAKSILSPVFWVHTVHNYCADKPSLNGLCPFLKPNNVILLSIATTIELIQLATTKKTSNLQIIMEKPE